MTAEMLKIGDHVGKRIHLVGSKDMRSAVLQVENEGQRIARHRATS